MADIIINAADVVAGSNATKEAGTAGEVITAGQAVYRASATGKYMLADNDSATAEVRQPRGIALNGATANQPLTIARSGDITIGGTLTAGMDYYLSAAPGGVCPRADILAGDYVCLLGLAKSTSVLALDIQYPGVAL
ncbi:hypothetical protein [Allomesorhizobium alhagi]|uniref:Uncharacterized protein n=1 Tax=Mesorhizobium alhagi CCNWXJ12-2 TaxID=1107882 RepID=H0HR43_9HYPH|nr:hypothetical protein [Mesorhizobium alhagi]EHK56823.1 hypothetical protein MAXJ12_13131 [Mesorhizobium alhagi CCNWXJ12-2]